MKQVQARTRGRVPFGERASVLPLLLDAFARNCEVERRLAFDPVEFPRRYMEPADIEVAGLIATTLAYGRADVFKKCIERILSSMGTRPSLFAQEYARAPRLRVFGGARYRFNEPADFAALVASIGSMIAQHGSLGRRFGALLREEGSLRSALARFADELRQAPPVGRLLRRRGGRGLRHLLPDARQPGACKRWHLYLRWMVRGPDAVDLGVWREHVPTSALLIPLDTHIARIAGYLGLTDRSDLSWLTAEQITESLRRIDPVDPVRFDFALCHHGMSGACPRQRDAEKCVACPLAQACQARLGVTKDVGRPAKLVEGPEPVSRPEVDVDTLRTGRRPRVHSA